MPDHVLDHVLDHVPLVVAARCWLQPSYYTISEGLLARSIENVSGFYGYSHMYLQNARAPHRTRISYTVIWDPYYGYRHRPVLSLASCVYGTVTVRVKPVLTRTKTAAHGRCTGH